MNKNTLESVLKNKGLFIPLIFTEKQFNVLKKYNKKIKLSNAEKKALYTSIKKKMTALNTFSREQKDAEYYINGASEIIPARLAEAKQLLNEYAKKYDEVFISGSFLFSKQYGDIDVFIIKERGYKEIGDGNKHLVFLSEKRLSNPVFQSAALISVANFMIPNKISKKKPVLSDLMATYHEAVIEYLNKEKKQEAARQLIFNHSLFCKNKLLNPKELKEMLEKIKLTELDEITKSLCKKLFSKTYLYVEIHTYIDTLKESIKNIKPNKHLIQFRNTYEEIIYGRKRSAAETA